jgi:ring-1,2-phenylacetyl-CoA epoxidase subunit PaaE
MARPAFKLDRPTVALLVAQWTLFVGNFAVYATNPLPLPIHIAIGALAIHLAFTIWHEAAHGTVSNRKWLNNAVGIMGMLPYMTPFFLQRRVHLDHHKYLNVPGYDPNLIYADGPYWQLPFRYVRAITYTIDMLQHDPRSPGMRRSDNVFLVVVIGAYVLAALSGHLVDILLLWFVPAVIAKVIMDWYVNYLPHVGLPIDRFLGTRILDVGWMTPLLLAHNYHAVHHLWPTIPWHRYIARYREKREYLEENRVPIETRLFGPRLRPRLPASPDANQSLPGDGTRALPSEDAGLPNA